MANGFCKCGTLKENPKASYCHKCHRAYQQGRKAKDPEAYLAKQRENDAKRSAESKAKKYEKHKIWADKNRERRNAQRREWAKTWSEEKKAKVKVAQDAYYNRLQERRLVGLCAYSTYCNHPPLGGQKFCLEHWCRSLRQADLRVKDKYTQQELVDLWKRQDGKCAISGIALIAGVTAEIDHIIPLAKGGSGKIENVHFVHWALNRMKWDMPMDEFRKVVSELLPGLSEWIRK